MVSSASIDDYITGLTPERQLVVEQIQAAIHARIPGAGETIKYEMPTITLAGRSLVHFAAWQHHVGLYPLPVGEAELATELAPYATGKGTATFTYAQPIPYDLIARAVQQLAHERG